MSSDEEQEITPPIKRKRGRPPKTDKESPPKKGQKVTDDGMDGIHYACDVCEQVFLHKSNYLRHSDRHEPPGGFICSLCLMPFTTEWDRNKHKRDQHSVFRCRICQAEFAMEADYIEHIQEEHEGRDCEYDMCPTCGQQFKSASQLKIHVDSKCGKEKKYKCSECKSLHLSQAALNTHMIKHVDKKGHGDSGVDNKDQPKEVQQKSDQDEKPYKCNKCDKAFARRDNLIAHFLTHSGSKPYNCSYCDSRFSCIGNLLKHRRSRPDTCGLPQYCLTKKSASSPIKANTMSSPENTKKDVQNKVTPKDGKTKNADEKPTVEKKTLVQKTIQPTVKPLREKKPNITTVQVEVKRERKKSESQHKMVVLQVVSQDDDYNEANDEEKHDVEIGDIKIEEEGQEDSETHEVLFETVIEPEDIKKFTKNDDDSSENENDEYQDQDDSEDYQPPPEYDEKGIRRTFTEKPPVITKLKRRGRMRHFKVPKPVSEDIIVLDLDEQQRTLDAQRSIYDLNVHHIASDCYRCAHCPMQYASPYFIGRHLESDHGIVLKELLKTLRYDREYSKERKFKCRYCNRLYVNEKALEKHVPLHGPDGKLLHKCTCCPRHFATEEEVHQHAVDDHTNHLLCKICGKVFPKHCHMVKHVREVHEGQKPAKMHYVCPKCGKPFSSKGAVSDHERSQCGKNPIYQCEICQKCLHSASSLKNHYMIHTDELPFSCQYCGKGYRSRGQVKVHERQHTGEKPFQCEFCSKSFGHRETLQTHRSSHTGIKRYMCSGCGQRFACISNLQCHRRTHKDTCGTIPTVSRVVGPDGYHDLPPDYVLPFPKVLSADE